MKMKVAVVGPESSGTKLMTRILQASGAKVLHRSFPYGGGGRNDPRHWPEADVITFQPYAIVWMNRDWWATARAQVATGHVKNTQEAWGNIQMATERIGKLAMFNKYYMINYESLVTRPNIVVANLTGTLGLDMPEFETIVDGNGKHLDYFER